MATGELELTPAGLRGASGIITGHAAQVRSAPGSLGGSAELSGVAAGAMHGAFDGYCQAFSQRLSTVSAALVETASSFADRDYANCQVLACIAPGEDAAVSGV
jgi:hypothetical protein